MSGVCADCGRVGDALPYLEQSGPLLCGDCGERRASSEPSANGAGPVGEGRTAGPASGAAAVDGAAFFLDAPNQIEGVWGTHPHVLWARGEPLMIAGPDGVGKTTLAQQLMMRRAGVGADEFLGMAITPDPDRRVLYLALDRPRQAARSGRRMVGEANRDALRSRLVVWRGSVPFDVVRAPDGLRALARQHGAGMVIIDSLKDLANNLSDEDTGSAINQAMQACVAADIEVLALHHQRKAQGDNKKPRTLADVYGSRWLTAGCGSVVVLWGDAGDPIVELSHLKQPADEVGPLTLLHDNRRGTTIVHDELDLVALVLRQAPEMATARSIAAALSKRKDPTPNETEKARRRLDAETEAGRLVKHPDIGPRHQAGYTVVGATPCATPCDPTRDPTGNPPTGPYVVEGREDPPAAAQSTPRADADEEALEAAAGYSDDDLQALIDAERAAL
ncbi:MAG: replicative helicase [Solirubrobacteraceae bacterium]|nr:replicative helicase [Solirubrobacteraceae bacterium]